MSLFSKNLETLDELFVLGLRTVYYAEHQIAEALPKMIEKATAPELRAALERHLDQTHAQIRRAEQVCAMHGVEPKQLDCVGIDGILKAGGGLVNLVTDPEVRDAAIVSSCQLVEHYEIAQYGSLIAWVRELGRDDCASVLEQTLNEEKDTDQALTRIAEGRVNARARPRAS